MTHQPKGRLSPPLLPSLLATLLPPLLLTALCCSAQADIVTDWNQQTNDFIGESKLGTPPAVRVAAIVQTAAYQALARLPQPAAPDAAAAALATAHRATLTKLLPAQQALVDAAARTALAGVADSPAKTLGMAAGERAAADVLHERLDDGIATPDTYRPATTPGVYVPTATVAITTWAKRKPWHMASAAQFRPGPPPALTGEAWARDYNEVRTVGGRTSTRRTSEQTDVARFWEYSLPAIYHGVLRSVALQPQRTALANARLFAVAAQAMDDGLIADGDAKYQYNFWRPITAIRNGDTDGNDATPREAGWASLIESPMHAEYPSAHSTLAAAVASVIKAELAGAPMPVLATSSPSARGATRRWSNVDDFVQEVSDARVWGGIHFRSAVDAGMAMGRQIGALAAHSFGGTTAP